MNESIIQYTERMQLKVRSAMAKLAEKQNDLLGELAVVEGEFKDWQAICPHLKETVVRAPTAEADDYSICDDCGANL